MLLRVDANPQVADINGNTPLHFFALAAAEEGVAKGDSKKDEKGTAKQKEERNKSKRNADAIEALASNRKCQNWYGESLRPLSFIRFLVGKCEIDFIFNAVVLLLAFQQRGLCPSHHRSNVGQA